MIILFNQEMLRSMKRLSQRPKLSLYIDNCVIYTRKCSVTFRPDDSTILFGKKSMQLITKTSGIRQILTLILFYSLQMCVLGFTIEEIISGKAESRERKHYFGCVIFELIL